MVGPSVKAKLLGLTSSRSTSEVLPILEGADTCPTQLATYLSFLDQASVIQCTGLSPQEAPFVIIGRHKPHPFSVYSVQMQFIHNSIP